MTSSRCGVFLAAVVLASCGQDRETEAGPRTARPQPQGAAVAKNSGEQSTQVSLKLVTVEDPVEKAYTIGMPEGWANRTYSVRVFDLHSTVDISVSPNGGVVLFAGDPSLPQYWSPHAATEMTYHFAKFNPRMRIEHFQPARAFFSKYVRRKYGRLPGFKLTSTVADPETERRMQDRYAEAGVDLKATASRVAFSYTDGGRPMRAMVWGQCSDGGAFWIPTVQGITTTGDPAKYLPTLDAMGKSRKMNAQWKARQAQKHQEAMAQIQQFGKRMTEQHHRNMAWIQQGAQRHQQRMQAIQAQADAGTRAFNDRMASSDAQHRAFLNYINDESTVVSSTGQTFQVDSGYQRYFVHKRDRTYVGGDLRMDLDRLRELKLNPDDYEEVKVRR